MGSVLFWKGIQVEQPFLDSVVSASSETFGSLFNAAQLMISYTNGAGATRFISSAQDKLQ